MPEVVQITSGNFEGQIALVTFYPCTGGTITIGYVTIPYNYEADYYFGTYTLYFPEYNETCDFSIPCPTPTPTPTKTTTPTRTNPKLTQTKTPTKTTTPTSTKYCYCYSFINNTPQEGKLQYYSCDNKFTQTIVENESSSSFCISLSSFTASSYVSVVQSGPCSGGICTTPTPTPSVTSTQTRTPTITPTQTVTKTQNSTPKPTRTQTATPTPSKIPQTKPCDVLYVTRSSRVYSYDPSTNTSIELTSLFNGPSIVGYSLDIAHTQDTLWLLGDGEIQEWLIQLSPFEAQFSRYITLPNTNIGDGLGVVDNLTLILSRYSDVPNIANQIIKLDITTNTGVAEIITFLPVGRFVVGDISYNSSGKLLITNGDADGYTFISQYDYSTGLLEIEVDISSSVSAPAGLYSYNSNIFVINYDNTGQSYSVDLGYPYNINSSNIINSRIKGTSQLTNCFNNSFKLRPDITPTPTRTLTPTKTSTPTKTTTPTVTPTKCCANFDMYGGTPDLSGATFQVSYCNGTTGTVSVSGQTLYSLQYGGYLCAYSVTEISTQGEIYDLGCGCVDPTPSPTPTQTITPSKLNECIDCGIVGSGFTGNQISLESCDVLLRAESKIYKYNLSSPNSSTELSIPNLSVNAADLTHTSNKLFTQFNSLGGGNFNKLRVWDIILSPFGATYSQDIDLDFSIGFGIFAKNNTTLIVTTGTSQSCFVEIDITDPIYVESTFKFCLSSNRKVSNGSNFILNDQNKLIVSNTLNDVTDSYYITQYDYSTGELEQDILVATQGDSNISRFVILENSSQMLIGKSNIYNISTSNPYGPLTLFGNPNFPTGTDIFGASQRYNFGCLPAEFSPQTTPTNTPTQTSTPTPTNTSTPTPTPSVTPIICPSIVTTTNTGYILSPQVAYNNDELIQSDVYYGYQYYMISGDTYVFDSGGTYVTNVGRPIETQVFDTTLFKYYGSYSNSGSGTTRIYDFDLNLTTEIILSGCPNPNSSTYNGLVGKVGILDTYSDNIAIIDSATESLDGYITLSNLAGYKGIIESDSINGTMYVINAQGGGNNISVVDPSTLTKITTISFTANSQVVSMTFNPTNGYMYILQSDGDLRWIDANTNTFIGSHNLSYLGTYSTMTYDVNKDYLYISNLQSSNIQNIIVFNCFDNTELKQISSIQLNNGEGIVNYNPLTSLLWLSFIDDDDLISLCT